MPTYKLTYFNARGRAEVVRLMFAAAGVEYEDKRITREEWASLKPSTPMGVIPLFEVDGKLLGQSTTIWRYVAVELGFSGSTHWEAAKIDEMVETLMELAECVKQLVFIAKTEEEKAAALNKLKDEKLPQILKFVEHMLKENGNNGWLVGNKLSLADIATFHMVSQVCNLLKSKGFQGFCADFPNARQHIHKIRDMPKIKHWIETRPQTDM